MQKEPLAEYLKRNHLGEANAITSKELELIYGVRGKELRNAINTLRRDAVPIASSSEGYFYAATEQEVRATISHMQGRITGIAAAISGLNRALEDFDTDQYRLPLDGGGGP